LKKLPPKREESRAGNQLGFLKNVEKSCEKAAKKVQKMWKERLS
jgi:hypothetical protein